MTIEIFIIKYTDILKIEAHYSDFFYKLRLFHTLMLYLTQLLPDHSPKTLKTQSQQTNIFLFGLNLTFRIYSYSFSLQNLIFVTHWCVFVRVGVC